MDWSWLTEQSELHFNQHFTRVLSSLRNRMFIPMLLFKQWSSSVFWQNGNQSGNDSFQSCSYGPHYVHVVLKKEWIIDFGSLGTSVTFTTDTHNCDKLDSVSVNLSLSSVSTLYSVTTHELVLFILIINESIMLLLHFSIISCRRCFVKNSTLKYAAKLFCSQILSYRDRCLRCFTHVLIACFNTTHPQSCTTIVYTTCLIDLFPLIST